jgi:adenylate kinase family enzyme
VTSRVLIYGVTGSGKTTLARQLAGQTGLPWHSVDDLTWEPGWVGVAEEEQRRRIATICAGERWVLDAGYSRWIDVVLARVELVVALDYPRWRSLARLTRRTLGRAVFRRTVCNGNTETFRQMLSRDSILVWHFRSFARKRAQMRAWAAGPAGFEVIRLTSPAATRRWLASLQPAGTPSTPASRAGS